MARNIKDVEFFSELTGEQLELEYVEKLRKKDYAIKIRKIYNKLSSNKIDELSLDDIELVMKLEKRNCDVSIDFKEKGERFFIVKDNRNISKDLSIHTKAMMFDLKYMISHDNTLVTKNNIPISSYKQLCDYLDVSYNVWKKNISNDNKKYKIIKKEVINNKSYLVLSPLFSIKSRNITEYTFKCFYEELKEYLHPLDYLYLVKLYGVDPSKLYICTNQPKNIDSGIDFKGF